jgi:hypothetical protein
LGRACWGKRLGRSCGGGGGGKRGSGGLGGGAILASSFPLRAPGRFPLAQWRAVRLGWGPQSGLADPAAPGVSASARRNRRGKLSLWA